jgi:hypothetical protein
MIQSPLIGASSALGSLADIVAHRDRCHFVLNSLPLLIALIRVLSLCLPAYALVWNSITDALVAFSLALSAASSAIRTHHGKLRAGTGSALPSPSASTG